MLTSFTAGEYSFYHVPSFVLTSFFLLIFSLYLDSRVFTTLITKDYAFFMSSLTLSSISLLIK